MSALYFNNVTMNSIGSWWYFNTFFKCETLFLLVSRVEIVKWIRLRIVSHYIQSGLISHRRTESVIKNEPLTVHQLFQLSWTLLETKKAIHSKNKNVFIQCWPAVLPQIFLYPVYSTNCFLMFLLLERCSVKWPWSVLLWLYLVNDLLEWHYWTCFRQTYGSLFYEYVW